MIRLYDNLPSGNGYKVRLLLTKLGIPFERVELDLARGDSRQPGYLAKNPVGKIPAMELDDGTVLSESGAILFYFAEGTPYLPDARLERAQVLQWMFFEQYSHEPYVAVLRSWHRYGLLEQNREQLSERTEKGYAALKVMDDHLSGRAWFVGSRLSIADIALYAYTHVADEGGFDLSPYRNVGAWLDRVAAEPGHIPISQA